MNKKLLTGSEAIREGLIEAGKKNNNIIFFAEGIDDPSSVYGTTKDLKNFFNKKDRLIEMPLSENGIVGIAIGASIFKKIPIISLHRVEFAILALEQIINNAAKLSYISMGEHKVPIIIRLIVGRGWGQGPEHSQSLENLFSMIPGLKVLIPSFPEDAKGMIISATRQNNPTIIIEHRWIHYAKSLVRDGYFTSNIEEPSKIISGNDITIVASSIMTFETLMLAKILKKYGVSIELIDLRVANPLKLKKIIKSVRKTGRLMTLDLGNKNFGIGSEIISQIVCEKIKLLSEPIKIGMPFYPTPSSRGYLKNHYPSKKMIFENILKLFPSIKKYKKNIYSEIDLITKNVPIDIPDETFKGPF